MSEETAEDNEHGGVFRREVCFAMVEQIALNISLFHFHCSHFCSLYCSLSIALSLDMKRSGQEVYPPGTCALSVPNRTREKIDSLNTSSGPTARMVLQFMVSYSWEKNTISNHWSLHFWWPTWLPYNTNILWLSFCKAVTGITKLYSNKVSLLFCIIDKRILLDYHYYAYWHSFDTFYSFHFHFRSVCCSLHWYLSGWQETACPLPLSLWACYYTQGQHG